MRLVETGFYPQAPLLTKYALLKMGLAEIGTSAQAVGMIELTNLLSYEIFSELRFSFRIRLLTRIGAKLRTLAYTYSHSRNTAD